MTEGAENKYNQATLNFVDYYKEKAAEMHYGKPLKSYGWYKYLVDLDLVSKSEYVKPQPRFVDKHSPHIPIDMDYTFDDLWEILLEYELYPEMLDIYLHREQTSTGLTHKGHVSMPILSAFREYLRIKYGFGWKVDKAMSLAIGFACSSDQYPVAIRDKAFIRDLKAGKFGPLRTKEVECCG